MTDLCAAFPPCAPAATRGCVLHGFMGEPSQEASPYLTSLVDLWPGDEVSGPLLGNVNGVNLSAINSPGTMAGPGTATARAFNSTTPSYFERSLADGLGIIGTAEAGLTVVGWWYYPTLASGYHAILKNGTAGSPPGTGWDVAIYHNSGSNYVAWAVKGDAGQAYGNSANLVVPNTWQFIALRYDPAVGRSYVKIGAGAWTANAGVTGALIPSTTAGVFYVGRSQGLGDGGACGLGAWSRALSDDDVDWFHNGGIGPRSAAEVAAYTGS